MRNKLWMTVTDDEYELPLGVYDTRKEMADAVGVSEDTVKSAVYKGCRSRYLELKFVKVCLGDQDEDKAGKGFVDE